MLVCVDLPVYDFQCPNDPNAAIIKMFMFLQVYEFCHDMSVMQKKQLSSVADDPDKFIPVLINNIIYFVIYYQCNNFFTGVINY